MASFMKPFTYHGAYYLVDTPGGTFLVVATDVPPDPTADDVEPFQPEGCWCADNTKHQWEITLHEGWYGRLSAPGYLDCTDWEWADSEEELLESLTDGCEDEECDDDDPRVSPDTDPEADEDHVAMVNGDHDNLDGVFLAMIHARRIGDDREATRLAIAYRDWLAKAGRTAEGYSRAEAYAEVYAIIGRPESESHTP